MDEQFLVFDLSEPNAGPFDLLAHDPIGRRFYLKLEWKDGMVCAEIELAPVLTSPGTIAVGCYRNDALVHMFEDPAQAAKRPQEELWCQDDRIYDIYPVLHGGVGIYGPTERLTDMQLRAVGYFR